MTTERMQELDDKLSELFAESLVNPTIYDCDCLFEGEDPAEHECICQNNRLPETVEAFDSAVSWLHWREGLSIEETTEFVNTKGKELLNLFGYDITFEAQDKSFLVSWERKAVVALPAQVLPQAQNSAHSSEAFTEASVSEVAGSLPRGAAFLLWRLLPASGRAEVLGDLAQDFTARRQTLGERRARLWVWKDVVDSVWPLLCRGARKMLGLLITEGLRRVIGCFWEQDDGQDDA